jgi:lysophospholipase L1-like esterase
MIPWRVKQLMAKVQERATDVALSVVTRRIPLPAPVADKRIVFIGASVGKEWRLHLVFPGIETLVTYEFDKSELVAQAVSARPDAIIIKECAAYFPSSSVRQELVPQWVERIRGAGIRPILATVVPVTRQHAQARPGRIEGLWAFNAWLRDYAAAEDLPLLDLEAALRRSSRDRYLDHGLDNGDGLHLSLSTYRRRLDPLIPPLLLRTFASG